MANPNFGTYVPVNSPDPDWITGWGKRTYNWQTSVNVDREVMPNVVVNVGYFRTWYGNFQVTDNLKVTPADYSPYCVTVPTDPRLPLSGQQLCGLYDINPDRVRPGRQPDHAQQRTTASRRRSTTAWTSTSRCASSARPRSAAAGTSATPCSSASPPAAAPRPGTDTCYVVDSPQQLFNCKVDVPYQNRIKLNGSYTFPYGIQVAAVFQSNPGANYGANRTYTLAEIQPSLGRPLSGGVTSITIPLVTPLSTFGPRINQFDLRGTKIFRIGQAADSGQRRRLQSVQRQHAGHSLRHLQRAVGTADAGARRAPGEVQRADRFLIWKPVVNEAIRASPDRCLTEVRRFRSRRTRPPAR